MAAITIGPQLLDRFRNVVPTGPLFTKPLQNGSDYLNEFDLHLVGGVYYLAYDTDTGTGQASGYTLLYHADSLAALWAAVGGPPDHIIANAANGGHYAFNLRYPSIIFDGNYWHFFGSWSNDTTNQFGIIHLVSTVAGAGGWSGPYTQVGRTQFGSSLGTQVVDSQVRLNPADGQYYCGYVKYDDLAASASSTYYHGNRLGMLKAATLSGTWTDLGSIWDSIGVPPWAVIGYDPTPVFYQGRAYLIFGAYEGPFEQAGTTQIGMVELDPVTMKAINTPVVIANTLASKYAPTPDSPPIYNNNPISYENSNGILLESPAGSGNLAIYANMDATAGMGEIAARGTPPNDSRLPGDVTRLDCVGGSDLATGLPIVLHHGAICTADGITIPPGGGAYGWINVPCISGNFALEVEFTALSLPAADSRACLFGVQPRTGAAYPAVYLNLHGNVAGALIYGDEDGTSSVLRDGSTVLTAGTRYHLTLEKAGTQVTLSIDGVLDAGFGIQRQTTAVGSPTWLSTNQLAQYFVGNRLGHNVPANGPFAGTIHNAGLSQVVSSPLSVQTLYLRLGQPATAAVRPAGFIHPYINTTAMAAYTGPGVRALSGTPGTRQMAAACTLSNNSVGMVQFLSDPLASQGQIAAGNWKVAFAISSSTRQWYVYVYIALIHGATGEVCSTILPLQAIGSTSRLCSGEVTVYEDTVAGDAFAPRAGDRLLFEVSLTSTSARATTFTLYADGVTVPSSDNVRIASAQSMIMAPVSLAFESVRPAIFSG